MVTHRNTKAEVTVHTNGSIYVGVNATEALGLQYNDRIRVTIPRDKKSDLTYTGCLTKADQITTGGRGAYKKMKQIAGFEGGGSFHIDVIIEPAARSWDDEHDLTDRRSDGCYTLDAKL